MIITVTPAPSIDRTHVIDTVRPGAVNRAKEVYVEASGKGVNVSRAVAGAGCDTLAILPVGGKEGSLLTGLLDEEHVRYHAVPVATVTRSNITVLADGVTTKLNAPAVTISDTDIEAILDACADNIAADDWVVFAGTSPDGAHRLVGALCELAHDAGARIAVDTSGVALREALKHKPDLLAPNIDELVEIDVDRTLTEGGDVDHIHAAAEAAEQLAALTEGAVLVSLGEHGAVFSDGSATWHAFGPALVPVNTARAADALLSGYLAESAASITGRLRNAIAWARAACMLPTTGGPIAETARIPDITVEPLTH